MNTKLIKTCLYTLFFLFCWPAAQPQLVDYNKTVRGAESFLKKPTARLSTKQFINFTFKYADLSACLEYLKIYYEATQDRAKAYEITNLEDKIQDYYSKMQEDFFQKNNAQSFVALLNSNQLKITGRQPFHAWFDAEIRKSDIDTFNPTMLKLFYRCLSLNELFKQTNLSIGNILPFESSISNWKLLADKKNSLLFEWQKDLQGAFELLDRANNLKLSNFTTTTPRLYFDTLANIVTERSHTSSENYEILNEAFNVIYQTLNSEDFFNAITQALTQHEDSSSVKTYTDDFMNNFDREQPENINNASSILFVSYLSNKFALPINIDNFSKKTTEMVNNLERYVDWNLAPSILTIFPPARAARPETPPKKKDTSPISQKRKPHDNDGTREPKKPQKPLSQLQKFALATAASIGVYGLLEMKLQGITPTYIVDHIKYNILHKYEELTINKLQEIPKILFWGFKTNPSIDSYFKSENRIVMPYHPEERQLLIRAARSSILEDKSYYRQKKLENENIDMNEINRLVYELYKRALMFDPVTYRELENKALQHYPENIRLAVQRSVIMHVNQYRYG